MSEYIAILIALIIAACAGTYLGDQSTLRDCRTTGCASMAGGGSITCSVIGKAAP